MDMIYHDQRKLLISTEFLLSPEAEPVRKVAESLYPLFLMEKARRGENPDPKPVPILDEEFMTGVEGRWARILAEVRFAEYTMRREGIEHTVVIFGSARIPDPEKAGNAHPFSRYYAECRELSNRLTQWSMSLSPDGRGQPFVVVTGGGPAIMEAGNRGAKEAGGKTAGMNITLPMEQMPNPYITDTLNFKFHYFFTRKFHFSYRAKVLLAFPGGFGTFDELFEFLTLIQTGKLTKPMLCILYGSEFWKRVVDFEYLAKTGMISKADLDILNIVDSVDEAFALTTEHLKQFLKAGNPPVKGGGEAVPGPKKKAPGKK